MDKREPAQTKTQISYLERVGLFFFNKSEETQQEEDILSPDMIYLFIDIIVAKRTFFIFGVFI